MNEIKDEATTKAGYLRIATIHLNLHYSSHRLNPASLIKKNRLNKLPVYFRQDVPSKSVLPINMS
jgi:hypothetical protein